MREFHNHYVKEILLYNASLKGGQKNVVDIACGTGSDIRRWINGKVAFVLGIDYAGDNITNTEYGAYAQYANHKERNKRLEIPPMVFVIGDTSKRIVDGRAGSTDEERDILRSSFGRYPPMGPIPPYVDHYVAGNLKVGADVMSCMFALHYFFKSKESLNGLLQNIREVLKVGGYFVGCCFDGDSVFNFLKDVPTGGTKSGLEKDLTLWNIRKDYDLDEFIADENSLGQQINVEFISIGSAHDEYLVSFPYFIQRMKENGIDLLTKEQSSAVGLLNSTSMFEDSYEMSKHFGKNYIMSDALKKFSFLNRWFIFVKSKDIVGEEEIKDEFIPSTITNKATKKLQESKINITLDKESLPESIVNSEAVKKFVINENIAEPAQISATERTLPVQALNTSTKKMYSANEVFNFYFDAALDDSKLRMGDNQAARWISPQTPFRIKDFDDPSIVYPSLEHFMGAMMYKYGAGSIDLAKSIFSRDDGFIHKSFLRKRLVETKASTIAIPYDKDRELIKDEINAVKEEMKLAAFRKYKVTYNEAAFLVKRDELFRKAVEQRYKEDERLRNILEAARKKGKYLLYYTQGTTANNLGGQRKSDGIIYGDNKLGKLYMELAGYTE
jgi:SAM-dependent methyltransferase